MCRNVSRRWTGVGLKCSSGITNHTHTASSRKPAPETSMGNRRKARLSSPAATVPATPANRWICCSRVNTRGMASSPISSVIQACAAPEVKVLPIPQTTWAIRIAVNVGTAWTRNPIPISQKPMITETRRLYRSATIPVGISKTKALISSTVPTSTICSGLRPTTVTM